MSIGERITELRNQKELSQNQLAKMMEVSRQAVSKWENDIASPDTLKLIKLAEVLETEVEYLATGVHSVVQPPPIVVNLVDRSQVSPPETKTVIRKVVRIQYRMDPIKTAGIAVGCFLLGLFIGFLI